MTDGKTNYDPESMIGMTMLLGCVIGAGWHVLMEALVDWFGGPWEEVAIQSLECWLCMGASIGAMVLMMCVVYILTKIIFKWWPLKAEDPPF